MEWDIEIWPGIGRYRPVWSQRCPRGSSWDRLSKSVQFRRFSGGHVRWSGSNMDREFHSKRREWLCWDQQMILSPKKNHLAKNEMGMSRRIWTEWRWEEWERGDGGKKPFVRAECCKVEVFYLLYVSYFLFCFSSTRRYHLLIFIKRENQKGKNAYNTNVTSINFPGKEVNIHCEEEVSPSMQ